MRPRLPPAFAAVAALGLIGAWWLVAADGGLISTVHGPADQRALPAAEGQRMLWQLALGVPLTAALWALWPTGARQARLTTLAGALTGWRGLLIAGVGLAAVRVVLLGEAPLTDDEWAYRFQAQTFAAGRLWATPPPATSHFEYLFLTVSQGKWFCNLQPGLAALMTPGEWALGDGFWSLLPLHAALVPAAGALARRLAGPTAAAAASALLLLSPWFWLTGATVEPYGVLALAVTVWLCAVIDLWRRPARAPRLALGLGGLTGAVLLIRGFEFGLLGLALLAVFAARAVRDRSLRWSLTHGLLFLLGLLPFVGLQLGYNAALTGDALTPPIVQHAAQRWYGFGAGVYQQHSLLDGLRLWGVNAARAAAWLTGAPLVVLALWGARRTAPALLAFAGAWWLAWLPYSLAGVADFGPVYLFALCPLLAALVAAGAPRLGPRGGALVPAAILAGALTAAPLLAWQAHRISAVVAAPYAGADGAVGPDGALVLVHRRFPAESGWVFGLRPPHPLGTDPVVFAWATPQDRQQPGPLTPALAWIGARRVLHVTLTPDGRLTPR